MARTVVHPRYEAAAPQHDNLALVVLDKAAGIKPVALPNGATKSAPQRN